MVQPPLVVVAELSRGVAKLLAVTISSMGSATPLYCNVAAVEPLLKSADETFFTEGFLVASELVLDTGVSCLSRVFQYASETVPSSADAITAAANLERELNIAKNPQPAFRFAAFLT